MFFEHRINLVSTELVGTQYWTCIYGTVSGQFSVSFWLNGVIFEYALRYWFYFEMIIRGTCLVNYIFGRKLLLNLQCVMNYKGLSGTVLLSLFDLYGYYLNAQLCVSTKCNFVLEK